VEFDPYRKKQLFSLRDTAMRPRSQRPLQVQGDACHPGRGPKKNNGKKLEKALEEERYKGSLPPPQKKKQPQFFYQVRPVANANE
jgi:hypothetical protein